MYLLNNINIKNKVILIILSLNITLFAANNDYNVTNNVTNNILSSIKNITTPSILGINDDYVYRNNFKNEEFAYKTNIAEINNYVDDRYIWLPMLLDNQETFLNMYNLFNEELNNKKLNTIILDFRFHLGGHFKYFVWLNYILNKQHTRYTLDKLFSEEAEESFINLNIKDINFSYNNLIILVDEKTASGYELLTYALKMNDEIQSNFGRKRKNNVTIIGTPTYGKTFGQTYDSKNDIYYTNSIITNINLLPIFRIYPDIYDFNLSIGNGDLNIREIYNKYMSLPIEPHNSITLYFKQNKIDNNKQDNNKTNNIIIDNNYSIGTNLNGINLKALRKDFYKKYTDITFKHYTLFHRSYNSNDGKEKICVSITECQNNEIKDNKVRFKLMELWYQYFKNISSYLKNKDNLEENEIEYINFDITNELMQLGYLKSKEIKNLNDKELFIYIKKKLNDI